MRKYIDEESLKIALQHKIDQMLTTTKRLHDEIAKSEERNECFENSLRRYDTSISTLKSVIKMIDSNSVSKIEIKF